MIDELLIQLTDAQYEMMKEAAEKMGIPIGAMGKVCMLELILEAHAKQIEQLRRDVQELKDICKPLYEAMPGCEYKKE
jgi:hypothetical protein